MLEIIQTILIISEFRKENENQQKEIAYLAHVSLNFLKYMFIYPQAKDLLRDPLVKEGVYCLRPGLACLPPSCQGQSMCTIHIVTVISVEIYKILLNQTQLFYMFGKVHKYFLIFNFEETKYAYIYCKQKKFFVQFKRIERN